MQNLRQRQFDCALLVSTTAMRTRLQLRQFSFSRYQRNHKADMISEQAEGGRWPRADDDNEDLIKGLARTPPNK